MMPNVAMPVSMPPRWNCRCAQAPTLAASSVKVSAPYTCTRCACTVGLMSFILNRVSIEGSGRLLLKTLSKRFIAKNT
jgi:hypothetical protein